MKKTSILLLHPHDPLFNTYLLSDEYVVDVVHISSHTKQSKIQGNYRKVFYVPRINKKPFLWCFRLFKVLIDNKYDFIHSNIGRFSILPLFIALFFNVKFIAHIHEMSQTDTLLKRLSICLLSRFSFKLLATSQQSGDAFFLQEKYSIFPNLIEYDRFKFSALSRKVLRTKFQFKPNDIILGNVGLFSSNKNQKFLVSVIRELIQTDKRFKLVIVGDNVSNLSSYIEGFNLSDYVTLIEFSAEIEKFYSMFDIFLFPSFKEGFGMSILEAQIAGLICVANKSLPIDPHVTDRVYTADLSIQKWVELIVALSKKNTDRVNFYFDSKYDTSNRDTALKETYAR